MFKQVPLKSTTAFKEEDIVPQVDQHHFGEE
jgi:hypothetical protein